MDDITAVFDSVISDLKPVNLIWQPYDVLQYSIPSKKIQVNSLYATGLCEPNDGVEFCFVPTERMLEYERLLFDRYKRIRITDNRVSICNEVFYTSKIEGADTTIQRTQQIHDGASINPDNYFSEKMLLGGFNATKYLNLKCNRVTVDILVEMWRILTDGCRNNTDIEGTIRTYFLTASDTIIHSIEELVKGGC